jgi:hypothetical protein
MIFPAYIYTWDGTHKVETSLSRILFVLVMISKISYVDTYKEDRQLRLKRCRIPWSSIHEWMSLGFGYGDVSHEIHVVC